MLAKVDSAGRVTLFPGQLFSSHKRDLSFSFLWLLKGLRQVPMTSNNVLFYSIKLASYNPRGVMIDFSEKGQVKHWITELQLSYSIVNRGKWGSSNSLNICFCRTWRYTTYNSVPIILILLANNNVASIYSVTICEQKTKDCAPLGSLQHKLQHRCSPSFIKKSSLLRF